MKKVLLFTLLSFIFVFNRQADAQPTTAYDFKMNDCNGKMHHLFSELDSGNVVVIEYFMISCSPCIDAGNDLELMLKPLRAKYGKKVRYFQFGFTNSYTCTQITDWVNKYNFTSVPFDSGGVQVAYYGGMGMPTTAVLAGPAHEVLFTNTGFSPGDTAIISKAIHKFFDTSVGIKESPTGISSISFYPNPVLGQLGISFNVEKAGRLYLTLTNLEGKKILDLSDEKISAGAWNKILSLPQLAEGLYLIRGEINNESFTKKITVGNK